MGRGGERELGWERERGRKNIESKSDWEISRERIEI